MIATSRPARLAASRTIGARSMWSCAVPWLKFSRTTLTLSRIICSSSSGVLDAGPSVATILVAWRGRRIDVHGWVSGLWLLAQFSHEVVTSDGMQDRSGRSRHPSPLPVSHLSRPFLR